MILINSFQTIPERSSISRQRVEMHVACLTQLLQSSKSAAYCWSPVGKAWISASASWGTFPTSSI